MPPREPAPTPIRATEDAALRARVVRRTPLVYAGGADRAADRPSHVRAASGLAWLGARLAIAQDDANFIALVDPRDGRVDAAALPAGAAGARQFDDRRGNKKRKLDLESLAAVPDAAGGEMLLAFGSGSSPAREMIASVRALAFEAPGPRAARAAIDRASTAIAYCPRLYARLRATAAFAGSELNVEGAVLLSSRGARRLRLFNRGNGAPTRERAPVNATCDLGWDALVAHLLDPAAAPVPVPLDVTPFDLGAIDGIALGFTDACEAPLAGGGRAILYSAAAEDSPDATRDGPLAGCAIGVMRADPATSAQSVRWTLLRGADGLPFGGKVEGIAIDAADGSHAWLVIDRDEPDRPSELCEVELEGAWLRAI